MNLDDIKITFFEECVDQMSALEKGLYEISSENADIEIVNSLFRAVHSIKGGAGSFGLDNLVAFAHVFESALDVIRTDITQISQPRIELLQRATDTLFDVIEVSRDGGEFADISSIEAALENEFELNHTDDDEDTDSLPDANFDVVPISILDFDLEETNNTNNYNIFFKPLPELYLLGHETQKIFKELASLGELSLECNLDDLPSLDEYNPETCYISWKIELSCDKPIEEIETIFDWVEGSCEFTIESPQSADLDTEPSLDDILAGLDTGQPDEDPVLVSPEEEAVPLVEIITENDQTPPSIKNEVPVDLQIVETDVATKPAPSKPKKAEVAKSIRVDSTKVDLMINLMGELVISQAMLTEEVNSINSNSSSPIGVSLIQLQTLTREIQSSVMAIRAQPIKPVFMRMSRVIREICSATGKKAKLNFEGEDTEVDSTVIEGLVDPLTHLIRNAIDHGVEDPERRKELNKEETGVINISASHNSGRIMIEIKDDGAGINRERVLEKAIQNGIVSNDANLSDAEIDDLIFAAGFSTADVISDVSGRGVGMDVVRQSVQGMGGKVSIKSTPDVGTIFSLSLPLTLAILDGMVINDCEQVYVVPVAAIKETRSARSTIITQIGSKQEVIKLRDSLVPVIDVAFALGFAPKRTNRDECIILIVETSVNELTALLVDEIAGQQQVVIKSLEANYQRVPNISAATILGSGRIALVLDVDEIVGTNNTASGKFIPEQSETEGAIYNVR